MKKLICVLLTGVLLTLPLCLFALAAGETVTAAGFYDIGAAAGVRITPGAASGAPVHKTGANVDGQEGYETFYSNSDKLTATYSGPASEGDRFLLILVTGEGIPTASDTLCYIDQTAKGTGSVTFEVLPLLPEDTTPLTLYITSDRAGFSMIAIPLGYAVYDTYDVAPYTRGDVDENGRVEPSDALLALKHYANLVNLTGSQMSAADANLDGKIDAIDALVILQYYAAIITW